MVKKRRKINKFKVIRFIIIVILIIVATGLGLKWALSPDTTNLNSASEETEEKEEETLEDKNTSSTISMIMVGDALIHDSIYEEASTLAGGNGYDFTEMFELIKPIVSNYDIAYYNQETILGGSDIGLSSYPAFNSPYELGDALVDAGFNLVSLATNHTLDRGEEAVLNSRTYWNSKTDVLAVGSYSSEEEREKTQIREVAGITYTMLNYTYGTNGISVPSGKDYLVNIWPVTGSNPETDTTYQNYKETVKQDIEKVRDEVDVLIVAMHWGTEYETQPNAYQIDMANFLAELDVDIIVGTHPHVIQPVAWIDDTLVIYSLGNFISAHEVVNLSNRVGLMTSLNITKDSDGNIAIDNVQNELLYTYYTSSYTSFKVIPFSQLTEDYLSDYKTIYNTYKDIVQSLDSSISVTAIG